MPTSPEGAGLGVRHVRPTGTCSWTLSPPWIRSRKPSRPPLAAPTAAARTW